MLEQEIGIQEENELLKGPELLSQQEIEISPEVNFNFHLNDNREYNLGYKDKAPFLRIKYYDSLPHILTNEEKGVFYENSEVKNGKERKVFTLQYGQIPEFQPHDTTEDYFYERRREIKGNPKEIVLEEFIDYIKSNQVIFYTGAGISIAGGVYDMKGVWEILGIDKKNNLDTFVRNAIHSPHNIFQPWERFVKQGIMGPTTNAHKALAFISQRCKAKILTENVDNLHQKTGLEAIHTSKNYLLKKIKPEWFKDTQAIVTIGLSQDDRGLLNWYKKNNPDGKIIAINLEKTPYLGKEDILLKGDCQEILPQIEKRFLEN